MAAGGDGLLPELRELLEKRAARSPEVVELEAKRDDGMVQSGPFPRGKMPETLPDNVVRLKDWAGSAEKRSKT